VAATVSDETQIDPRVGIVAKVLYKIGPVGMLSILWSAIVCVALLKADNITLERIWNRLYWTWLTIGMIWSATAIIGALAERKAARSALTPEIAEKEVAKSSPPPPPKAAGGG
jgi:hypothetical protein